MSTTREPVYKTRRVGPAAAEFDQRCYRINDFIVITEANSNVYLIETDAGAVLVNTGMGFEAPVIEHNLRKFSSQKIRYIISTQGHVDHVGGVQYFRDRNPGVEYIAQQNNEEHQNYDARLQPFRAARSAFRFRDDFMAVFGRYAEQGYTDINAQDRPSPDIIFDQSHEISLGGLQIQLIAVPGSETNDSLVIWLPQHRIVLTGNLFGCPFGHFPNLVTIRGDRYRDALVCAEAAKTVMALEPELLLYGHHEPVEGKALIRAELEAWHEAVLYVHDEVVKGMNEGKSLYQLQQDIQLPTQCEVGQGYGKVSWGVRAIWEYYAGWFKHESTTELYAVPQSDIHADLIELAGAEALVARAKKHVDENRPEQALHLLDIVLNADPADEHATSLAIEIHETLLQDAKAFCTTGNFWLVGWLQNRIKLLKGGKTASLSFN